MKRIVDISKKQPAIRDTGPKQPLVDPATVADALGAEVLTDGEWEPPIERPLNMTWRCIVCRCDQTSGRTCRAIPRPGEIDDVICQVCDPERPRIARDEFSFRECAVCEGFERPADLCSACLHNRHTIGQLLAEVDRLDGVGKGLANSHVRLELSNYRIETHQRLLDLLAWVDDRWRTEIRDRLPSDVRRRMLDATWGQIMQRVSDLVKEVEND